jgi:hypothetical protein
MTKTEREILDQVLQLHTGEEAAVYHYVLITKEIATPSRDAQISLRDRSK